jgi:phage shock protein A
VSRIDLAALLVAVVALTCLQRDCDHQDEADAQAQRIASLQQERDALREDVDNLVQQVGERDRLLRGVRAQLEEQREQTARWAEVCR